MEGKKRLKWQESFEFFEIKVIQNHSRNFGDKLENSNGMECKGI